MRLYNYTTIQSYNYTSKTPRTVEQKRFWAVARAARSFQTLEIHIALTYFCACILVFMID